MADPYPPVVTKVGDPNQRFGWCNDNHHDSCRVSYISNGDERRCGCPCHPVPTKKKRSKKDEQRDSVQQREVNDPADAAVSGREPEDGLPVVSGGGSGQAPRRPRTGRGKV